MTAYPERRIDTPLRRMVDERGLEAVTKELQEVAEEIGHPSSLAARVTDGQIAEMALDAAIEDLWGCGDDAPEGTLNIIDHISFDYYDNSLEIHFTTEVEDSEATPEQEKAIYDMGFSRFWLNFKGGKRKGGAERYYSPANKMVTQ